MKGENAPVGGCTGEAAPMNDVLQRAADAFAREHCEAGFRPVHRLVALMDAES